MRGMLLAVSCALALVGCGGRPASTFTDRLNGLSFRYPRGWSVTGFSHSVSPARLVVASYRVQPRDVEGDCGGIAALAKLPSDGVALLVIDYGSEYGSGISFANHSRPFRLAQFRRATYECFGDTYMVRFRRGGNDLQAHIALGHGSSRAQRAQVLSILDSIRAHS